MTGFGNSTPAILTLKSTIEFHLLGIEYRAVLAHSRIELLSVADGHTRTYNARSDAATHSLFKRHLTRHFIQFAHLDNRFQHRFGAASKNRRRFAFFEYIGKRKRNQTLLTDASVIGTDNCFRTVFFKLIGEYYFGIVTETEDSRA